MKKLLLFCLLLFPAGLFAQSFTVELSLEGEADGQPVQFATVSLIPQGQDKAVKYILSDDKGYAKLEKVRKGTYTLKAELLGYKPLEKAIKVEGDTRLGKLLMAIDSQTLDAARVSEVGNPITIKKDTIEYNATSFRTTDNDMLENLLKKLPGVEVASDGTITANGQTISKITIDGKTFFLDDPQLAAKNLPAKIVEKVKVVEKKSDQALFTGIDDGEEETVIDLSLKKGMMNGWFGNISGGGGHDFQQIGSMNEPVRWQGAAMVGNFTENRQISIILNGNNTNNRGFNDMAGSMMRSMRGGGGGMGGGSGWGSSNGVSTSWLAGLNGAWTLLDNNAMDLGGNYLYNGNNTLITEKSDKTTYLDDGQTLVYKSGGPYDLLGHDVGDLGGYGLNRTLTQGHRFGVKMDWKINENTSILFEPQVNFGGGNFNEYSIDSTWRTGALKNAGFTFTDGNNSNWTASGRLLLRQRLGKPGRTISANVRYSFSGNKLEGFNRSLSRSLLDDGVTWDGTPTDQWYDGNSNASMVSTRVVYTEPLIDNFYLETNAMYQWSRNNSTRNTFDIAHDATAVTLADLMRSEDLSRLTRNETYSRDITNEYHNMAAGMNLQYQLKKLRVQVGAAYRPTITDNLTNGKNYHSIVHNWSPQAMFNYEFSDNSNIRLFYRGQSNQPSTSQLMPVPDNSNPLSISFGNPYLKPYFTHRIRGHFGYTDKQTFFSIRGWFGGNVNKDDITSARWYDGGGVQYSMPVNGPLGGNVNFGSFINSPIAKSNFSLSNMLSFTYANNTNYVGISSKSADFTTKYYDAANASFRYDDFNRDFFSDQAVYTMGDYFTVNNTQSLSMTERFKLTFRNDFVEASATAATTMNKGWYTLASSADNLRFRNQVQAEMLWTIPGGVGLNADASYIWYNGYTNAENECIVNAEITKLLFKNQFTLSLKVFDILNQSRNHYVTDSGNVHSELHNNTLGRYVMISLTYRFGNFGQAGKQMESRMQRERASGRGPRF